MQNVTEPLFQKIRCLLVEGKANRVFAWKTGDFVYDTEPFLFTDDYEGFVYDGFCAANLCKYMIAETKKEGKVLLLLKPCDSRGLALLQKEHRIKRENIYALGIPCAGKMDIGKIRAKTAGGILSVREEAETVVVRTFSGETAIPKEAVLLDKCLACGGKEHTGCDELFLSELSQETAAGDKFECVEKIERLSAQERFSFWRSQLSQCIRCNACRNVCPACSCVKCVFDNSRSGMDSKANADEFEEKLYHIIRSFHVCGRCMDCGECSRVCPQKIPLHLLNRKYIHDIARLYGEENEPALLTFTKGDAEPSVIYEGGGADV